MRFNDLLKTVLESGQRSGMGALTSWRQCVDMLAQYDREGADPERRGLSDEERGHLVARMQELRAQLSDAQCLAAVVELGSRLRSPMLVRLFAQDKPAVCVAAMTRARLTDGQWSAVMSELTPTARGILRGRRDMGPLARRSLEQFGRHDLLLGHIPAPAAAQEAQDAQHGDGTSPSAIHPERIEIGELVSRIEQFTSRPRPRAMPPTALDREEPAAAPQREADDRPLRVFTFETDAGGTIIWVGEHMANDIIGLELSEPAIPSHSGVDGSIAGAFTRRSSFQHGRFWVSEGRNAGEWRLSATPFFDQLTGRFLGYRGQGRRPHMHEVPFAAKQQPARLALLDSDMMRQLIHELRTPLNAILGFAEIIEQQLFGPAGMHYREMAGHILSDARRLLTAFDDLDMAARASVAAQPHAGMMGPGIDVGAIVDQVASSFEGATRDDGAPFAGIAVNADPMLPPVALDAVQAERTVQHLFRTLLSVSMDGERLHCRLHGGEGGAGDQVHLSISRPARLASMEEDDLFDPNYGADGGWPDAPLLGLGFSLRLVRSIAEGFGGKLSVDDRLFTLSFPVHAVTLGEDEAART